MVAPADRNIERHRGTFAEAILNPITSTWTNREAKAIRRRGIYSSNANVIRGLLDPEKVEALIRETERQATKVSDN